MTFLEIIAKLRNRFLWLILAVFLGSGISFRFFSADTFEANLTLGMHFNSDNFLENKTDSYQAYLNSMPIFSNFLVNSFASVYTQNEIGKEIGQEVLANKKPFFEIQNSNPGFITLSYKTETTQKAAKFIETTQKVYQNEVIPNWNQNRLSNFSVKPLEKFESIILQNKAPIQNKVLPVIATLTIFLVLIILIPGKVSKK